MPIMTKPIKQRGKLRDELPTLKRLLKTIFSNHRGMLVVSFIAILYHSFILMAESLFLRYLVNRYIVPLMHMRHPNFTNLAIVLVIMAVMYLLDVIAVALYTQLMVIVAQKRSYNYVNKCLLICKSYHYHFLIKMITAM